MFKIFTNLVEIEIVNAVWFQTVDQIWLSLLIVTVNITKRIKCMSIYAVPSKSFELETCQKWKNQSRS